MKKVSDEVLNYCPALVPPPPPAPPPPPPQPIAWNERQTITARIRVVLTVAKKLSNILGS